MPAPFSQGWVGYIRKLAVCQNPLPEAVNLPLKLARRIGRAFGRAASLVANLLVDPGLQDAEKQKPSGSAQMHRQA